ncbi:MAG: thioredoxin family protein [Chloroherpetonaceae bacterium]|nr:thioredoxin family protein [Chloroherpetonaceae bacterium]
MPYRFILLTLLLLLSACSSIQPQKEKPTSTTYKVLPDPKKSEQVVLLGTGSWKAWQQEAKWNHYDAADYAPKDSVLQALSKLISEKRAELGWVLFAGSWCGDSKEQVPIVFKVFASLGVPDSLVQVKGVTREKQDFEGESQKYKIERVPTLVVLWNGSEIGRIVETPTNNWETDLLEIINKP